MPAKKSFTNVYALLSDRPGRLWIGAQGIYHMDGKKLDQIPNTPPGFTVNVLLEDRKGNLWIGSDAHGVGYLDGKRLSFFNTDSGLTSNTILSLYEDQSGAILAGTQAGGLNRYQDGRWGAVTSENGLPDNVVNSLIRADDGTIWMSTNKGLFGVSEASIAAVTDKKVSHIEGVSIDSRDFLQSTEFGGGLQTCAAKAPDGTLWFVSLKGLVGYNPQTSRRKLPPPSIRIETVSVNGQSLQFQDGMELGPGVRSIQFEYVAFSYILPAATRYAFFLDGFSDHWIDVKNQKEAMFTNLSPGSYTFRVHAANSDGIWSKEEATLRFVILPFFWQTGLFKLLVVVLFVLLVFGAYRIRIRQMVRREEQLQRSVEDALAKIKVLHGLIPICASCKKIRDDKGYWNHLEMFLRDHSEAVLSHSICPDCAEKLYPDEMKRIRERSGRGAK